MIHLHPILPGPTQWYALAQQPSGAWIVVLVGWGQRDDAAWEQAQGNAEAKGADPCTVRFVWAGGMDAADQQAVNRYNAKELGEATA